MIQQYQTASDHQQKVGSEPLKHISVCCCRNAAGSVSPFFPTSQLNWSQSHSIGCIMGLSQFFVIIAHLTQSEYLVWNINEGDKNTEIVVTWSLVPDRIINASTPINVLIQPPLTHNNYLIFCPPHIFSLASFERWIPALNPKHQPACRRFVQAGCVQLIRA